MSGDGWEDLLNEARARLTELEGQGAGGELGDRVELAEGDHFQGRWRGEAVMHTKAGDNVVVFALWDTDGNARFHYKNAALVLEVDENRPEIGDKIVIVRGDDRVYEAQGETRRMHRYVIRTKPSSDPLPGAEAAAELPAASNDDIPF